MKPPHDVRPAPSGAGTLWWVCGFFLAYVLSAGPVGWATNDGEHPRYLSEAVNVIYLPLTPLLEVPVLHDAFYYYTVILWRGWPAGYTTL